MQHIVEVEGVNPPRELRQFRLDDRWVAYTDLEHPGVPTSYSEAVREAIALGINGCVGYVIEEPAPVVSKPDYSKPLPSLLSRKKRGVPDKTS
jgi:hypothetical protein